MSGVKFRAVTGQIALSAATAKTVLQIIAGSNHRVVIEKIIVGFEGVAPTDAPVQVRILKQTTAGTMTSLTLVKDNDNDDETLEVTASHTATAEPTASDVKESQFVHPQGSRTFVGPFVIPGGQRLGVEVTAPNAVDCIVSAFGEE